MKTSESWNEIRSEFLSRSALDARSLHDLQNYSPVKHMCGSTTLFPQLRAVLVNKLVISCGVLSRIMQRKERA